MKNSLLIIFLLLAKTYVIIGQSVSGTIYYADGTSLNFKNMSEFVAETENSGFSSLGNLAIFHQGLVKQIPISNISEVIIVDFERANNFIHNAQVTIKTKTTQEVLVNYKSLQFLKIDFIDELTGSLFRNQTVYFGRLVNGKYGLYIKRLVFK